MYFQEKTQIQAAYETLRRDKVTRAGASAGLSFGLLLRATDIFVELNKPKYNDPCNPFRFKRIFSWTNAENITIHSWLDFSNPWYTDGQIVGDWSRDFEAMDQQYMLTFHAIATSLNLQLSASDPLHFWKTLRAFPDTSAVVEGNNAAAGTGCECTGFVPDIIGLSSVCAGDTSSPDQVMKCCTNFISEAKHLCTAVWLSNSPMFQAITNRLLLTCETSLDSACLPANLNFSNKPGSQGAHQNFQRSKSQHRS